MASDGNGDTRHPANGAQNLELWQRRRLIADLYREGKAQHEIAALLNCSQQSISKNLKAIRTELRASAVADYQAKVEHELAKVDQLETEAWNAWYRSQRKFHERRRRLEGIEASQQAPPGEVPAEGAQLVREVEITHVERQSVGDPRFLLIISECIKRRCALLGLDTPEKLGGRKTVHYRADFGEDGQVNFTETASETKSVH